MNDLVIRGGTVISADGPVRADVGVSDGTITAIEPDLPDAVTEIDASGLLLLPGLIDVHLHFNEPGHTSWEGAASGSRGLAAGGGTTFFDMPLNSVPCTVTPEAFDTKREALEAASLTDFGIWGGIVPGGIDDMEAMAARGVVGFKAFMCDSGLPEFPRADELTLLAGMTAASRLGLPVAVHAESQSITSSLRQRVPGSDYRAYLATRPLEAELEAIDLALRLAEETAARLHIVHVSSGSGVARALEARQRGVDVSIETCPHYLAFTTDDLEHLGTLGKCAPPLRSRTERDALWSAVLAHQVDIVASDHSPSEPSMKEGTFMDAWGGIAGVQSTLSVLVDQGHHERGLLWPRIAHLTAGEPAHRFGLTSKGRLDIGYDADVVLIAPDDMTTLGRADLQQRHPASPYVGRAFRGTIRRTIRRGETLALDGRIVAGGGGRLVKPWGNSRSSSSTPTDARY